MASSIHKIKLLKLLLADKESYLVFKNFKGTLIFCNLKS